MGLYQALATAADVAVGKAICYVKKKGAFVRSEAPFFIDGIQA